MSAQTLTVVTDNPFLDGDARIQLSWKSDAVGAGNVAQSIASVFSAQAQQGSTPLKPTKLRGYIQKVETIPGLNGDKTTTCPDANYDMTLVDEYGADVAGGLLANLSASAAAIFVPESPIKVDSEIILTCANTGSDKTGRVIIYLTRKP